jgi:hypothetical protein
LELVAALIVNPHLFNLEVPSHLTKAAVSTGLILTERVCNKETQLSHGRRIITAPIQKSVEQSLCRRSDKRSDVFAIRLWQPQ